MPETQDQAIEQTAPAETVAAINAKRKGRAPKWKLMFVSMNIGDFFMVKNRAEANSARTSGSKYFKYLFKTKKQEDGQIRVERSA